MKLLLIKDENLIANELNDFHTEKRPEGLMDSIRLIGLRQPLSVSSNGDGTYKLLGGHRRLSAIRALKEDGCDLFKEGIPCVEGDYEIEDQRDELILIYEENIHNRATGEGINLTYLKTLLSLYAEKEEEDLKKGITNSPYKSVINRLSEKLGITERHARRLRHLLESGEEWLTQAIKDSLITYRSSDLVLSGTKEAIEESKEYFEKNGNLPEEVSRIIAHTHKKLAEAGPEWLYTAVKSRLISSQAAAVILSASKDAGREAKEYFDKNKSLSADEAKGIAEKYAEHESAAEKSTKTNGNVKPAESGNRTGSSGTEPKSNIQTVYEQLIREDEYGKDNNNGSGSDSHSEGSDYSESRNDDSDYDENYSDDDFSSEADEEQEYRDNGGSGLSVSRVKAIEPTRDEMDETRCFHSFTKRVSGGNFRNDSEAAISAYVIKELAGAMEAYFNNLNQPEEASRYHDIWELMKK